jgi:hypothetical protein
MIIKRMRHKHGSDRWDWYVDDSLEFHSLAEIKDYCRTDADDWDLRHGAGTLYKFKVIDTDEVIEILCSPVYDNGEFDYINVEGNF